MFIVDWFWGVLNFLGAHARGELGVWLARGAAR